MSQPQLASRMCYLLTHAARVSLSFRVAPTLPPLIFVLHASRVGHVIRASCARTRASSRVSSSSEKVPNFGGHEEGRGEGAFWRPSREQGNTCAYTCPKGRGRGGKGSRGGTRSRPRFPWDPVGRGSNRWWPET